MSSRNRTFAPLLVALLVAGWAFAQELEISVSPSPVGSGARAAGMADAFVAIADDATAASWNPAGLVQLERPEIAFAYAWNGVYETFAADWHPEVDSSHDSRNLALNFLSVTYPLPFLVLEKNAVVGLYYQQEYDFTRKLTLRHNTADGIPSVGVLSQFQKLDFEQKGGLNAITPAFAIELTQRLSLGLGVNIYHPSFLSKNGWEQDTRWRVFANLGGPYLSVNDAHEEYKDVSGESLTAGLLWNITDKWSFGARYDSRLTAEADYTRRTKRLDWDIWSGMRYRPRLEEEERTLRFPATVAIGASHRFNDLFTLSMDISRTDWNDFWFRGADDVRVSLVNAASLDARRAPDFDPAYTVRLGGEYVFLPRQPEETLPRLWTLRGGVFYDQEPASGHPDDFYGLALGVGFLWRQRVNIDAAYQMRCGSGVNGDFIRGVDGFNEDVVQHRFILSTVIYF